MTATTSGVHVPLASAPPSRESGEQEQEDDLKAPDDQAALRQQIEATLEPYSMTKSTQPPFANAELLAMAILCSDRRAATVKGAVQWVKDNLPYYCATRTQAPSQLVHAGYKRPVRNDSIEGRLFLALDCYEAPLLCANLEIYEKMYVEVMVSSESEFAERELTVPSGAARLFLRKWLEPEREG